MESIDVSTDTSEAANDGCVVCEAIARLHQLLVNKNVGETTTFCLVHWVEVRGWVDLRARRLRRVDVSDTGEHAY
jgi:hypothetical protein